MSSGHRPPAPRQVAPLRPFLRARIWLTSAMWAPVLGANLLAIVLALLLPVLDEQIANQESFPLGADPVRSIFASIATGMITFTGIVFAAVFVAAQIQTSSYSPRVAARLRRDPVVIASLAVPTAAAVYALFALAAIGRQRGESGEEFVPAITVVFGLALAMTALATFVALVPRAFDNTQIGGILRRLMRLGHAVIDEIHPERGPGDGGVVTAPVDGRAVEVRHDGPSGVVAAIDRAAMLHLAQRTEAFVEVAAMVGQHLVRGTVTLRIHDPSHPPDPRAARRVLVLARQRTSDQDLAFTLRMLVDIAIRGLSPAVNDPTTAVQALDIIESLLVELYPRRPGPAAVVDAGGVPRGWVPAPTWSQYLELSLIEIRRYGARSPQVARRLRALHDRLLVMVDAEDASRVRLERRLLEAALQAEFPDPEERAIAERPDLMGLGGAH